MNTLLRSAIVTLAITAAAAPAWAQRERASDAQMARQYKDATTRIAKVQEAMAARDFAKAKSECAAILEKLPEFPDANFLMAKILYVEKDYAGALASIEKAKTGHANTTAFMEKVQQDRMSTYRRRRDQQNDSISDLRAKLARTTSDQERQAIQTDIERAERIRNDLDRIINTPPSPNDAQEAPPEYSFFHGNIFLRMNRLEDAEQQYVHALKQDPGYAEAANNLASVYYSWKQYDKALGVLEQAQAKGGTVNPDLKKAVLQALGKS